MSYGVIEYKDGKPVCEICKRAFNRVLTHVWQKHGLSEREYKTTFGFDLNKGICSLKSAEKSRKKAIENYDKVIAQNLLKAGSKSRFKQGDEGRTKDKVSEQTKIRLKERLKEPKMIELMKESGRKVGKSGLGNKKRWGNNESLKEENK
jgi:hypothetical protein